MRLKSLLQGYKILQAEIHKTLKECSRDNEGVVAAHCFCIENAVTLPQHLVESRGKLIEIFL